VKNLSQPAIYNKKKNGLGCNGFAYIALLILIASLGLVAATSVQLNNALQRRAAEEQLLLIGAEFSRALASYAAATPANQNSRPRTLDDLLQDPRYPNTRRHLRKIYIDPITNEVGWNLICDELNSGIVAITSLSERRPIKIGNFESVFVDFQNAESYRHWFFTKDLDDLNKAKIESKKLF